MATKGKMISRDAKRRIEVITKKIADLQELGVPCLFSYATTWTGGLFVVGDDRMTSIVKDEFLGKLKTQQSNCDASTSTFFTSNFATAHLRNEWQNTFNCDCWYSQRSKHRLEGRKTSVVFRFCSIFSSTRYPTTA